ncbi:protein WG repeat motif [Candidatus Termititenax aidoneus]|uniref:Protein WG repeat motif n=1 Tax=Termititenax aidoneus TaxID=2218524 RepID=A0A388TDI2_TERA1|nr:protein WG repeat motif [Candidatus Termititenax aidoneus]
MHNKLIAENNNRQGIERYFGPNTYIHKEGKYGLVVQQNGRFMVDSWERYYTYEPGPMMGNDYDKVECMPNDARLVIEYVDNSDFIMLKRCNKGQVLDIAIVDKKGRQIVDFGEYDKIGDKNKAGMFIVHKNGRYGVMNEAGELVAACQFEHIKELFPHIASDFVVGRKDGKYFFVNKKGNIKEYECDDVTDFHLYGDAGGIFIVVKDKKWGVLDINGNVVVECKYEDIYKYSSAYAIHVQLDGKWGVINGKGETIVKCLYDSIAVNSDYFFVKIDDKWGILNREGKTIIKCSYNDIKQSYGGFWVQLDGKRGVVNGKGETIVKCLYDSINESYGYFLVEINGKWGIISKTGKILEDIIYDEIKFLDNRRIATIKDGVRIVIDLNSGKVIKPVERKPELEPELEKWLNDEG